MEEQAQDYKNKRMKLMRFWLVGTFLIVTAAITTYIMTWTQVGVMDALMVGLPIWAITLVTCVAIYFGYQYIYLKNQ
jgi:hypothetical protein